MECVAQKSKTHCTCSYSHCDKHGNCCACVDYHRQRQQIPGCFFSPQGERLHDRSLATFIKDRGL